MDKSLSRIVADLFEKSKGGEELSSKINRFRDEINNVVEGENTLFGKFRELVESFREIIPQEKQRFNAAIKALSTTSKLSQQEIVQAINDQLGELKVLEKGLMPAVPGWREELKAMEARSQEMKGEISKLREKIVLLENEEIEIRNGMAEREKEMELIQKAMRGIFADIGTEITDIKKRIEEFISESAAARPVPHDDSIQGDIKKGDSGENSEIGGSSEPQDTEWQRKCPMCGGRINFHSHERMWQCYTCAYEESGQDEVQGKSDENNKQTDSLKTFPVADRIFDPFPPRDVPPGPPSSNEIQKSKKKSALANIQSATKKKTCPSCRKKMLWFPEEKAWRCPFCEYERSI